MPYIHPDDLASDDDDDVDDYVPPASLPHNSVDGATVAVHWVLYIFISVRFTYLLSFDLFYGYLCLFYVF